MPVRAHPKRFVLALLLLSLGAGRLLPLAPASPSAPTWLIVPGVRAGPLTANTDLHSLVQMFGSVNAREAEVRLGEGEPRSGVVIFPRDPARRAEIQWKEPNRKRLPEAIIVTADETYKSLWRTQQGITLGTTLRELQQLNGRPFMLTGFDWDGGGIVTSWRGGRLEKALGEKLMLVLQPADPDRVRALGRAYATVSGYQKIRSDYWVMQKLNPRVYQMVVSF